MFTGIIEDIGKVVKIVGETFYIKSKLTPRLNEGSSIAVDGICLTVIKKEGDLFLVEVSAETKRKGVFGKEVNLETSLTLNKEIGGHLLMGHIDGTGIILNKRSEGKAIIFEVKPPVDLIKYIKEKGSIGLNGVSLTPFQVRKDRFFLSIIPYTQNKTNLMSKKVGDKVNIEVDILAKYLCQK